MAFYFVLLCLVGMLLFVAVIDFLVNGPQRFRVDRGRHPFIDKSYTAMHIIVDPVIPGASIITIAWRSMKYAVQNKKKVHLIKTLAFGELFAFVVSAVDYYDTKSFDSSVTWFVMVSIPFLLFAGTGFCYKLACSRKGRRSRDD